MGWRAANRVERLTAAFGLTQAAVVWPAVDQPVVSAALLATNGVLAGLLLWGLPQLRRNRRVGASWLGHNLPLLIFYVFYREIGVVLARPGVVWHDQALVRLEAAVGAPLGGLDGSLAGPWLAVAYMLYVPFLVATSVLLHRQGPQSPTAPAERAVASVCLSWAACYLVFLLYPVMGPRHLQPAVQLDRLGDGAVRPVAVAYQELLLLRGAAFPSAHVAATVVCLLGIWTWRRDSFLLASLAGVSIMVATVYLGYHYTADALAGALVGLGAFALDGWWTARGAKGAA
jgi:membrane-associated phospholipid phosphatase